MQRALVINCSAPHYNLGARKLADWLRTQEYEVEYWEGDPGMFGASADLVCLSVIFSWHAPIALQVAMRVKNNAEVWCGGPGMFALKKWWHDQSGIDLVPGLDSRFENQQGQYRMTFASRGCPVNCYFCIVPRLEGTAFTLNWNFQPAPILCDNNLSALPDAFQDHIIRRYQEDGVVLQDCNSGFEPRTFTEDTYHRWKPFYKGAWRFALDETRELEDVGRMMDILKAEPASKKRVYVLIGNEPIQACYERAQKVIEWGGEPYVQPIMPLNALSRDDLKVRHDWTKQKLKDFARFYNRWIWRSVSLQTYRPRKHESPLFATL
jgi:pyruvate-formate lyase-activating enzyme